MQACRLDGQGFAGCDQRKLAFADFDVGQEEDAGLLTIGPCPAVAG